VYTAAGVWSSTTGQIIATRRLFNYPGTSNSRWVHPGAVVIERSFADAFGVHAGDRITLNGRPFTVAGVAVTAAFPVNGVGFLEGSSQWPNPGLIWTTTADTESLATRQYPLGYVLNLKLTTPGDAENFADRFDPAATPTTPAAFTSSRGR
jgi:putative ABC transport system permease protein